MSEYKTLLKTEFIKEYTKLRYKINNIGTYRNNNKYIRKIKTETV